MAVASSDLPHVLIISHEFDPHVDRMVTFLKNLGVRCDRWITGSFPRESRVTMDLGIASAGGQIDLAGGTIDLTTVRSVWYRHPSSPALPDGLSAEERRFADAEIRSALTGLFQLFDWFWINHPDRIRVAASKILQLRRARDLGFKIPPTLVTNKRNKIREFFDVHGDIIYKPFTPAFFSGGAEFCYTSPITRDELSQADLIQNTPGIFQKNIQKRVELRITVIGRRVYATEIHSQEIDAAINDWRAGSVQELVHVEHQLPSEVEKRCLDYVRSYDLVFGAIDMILTPENEYIFLENNPSGQFGWIEAKTGEPLTAALAELLIAGEVV